MQTKRLLMVPALICAAVLAIAVSGCQRETETADPADAAALPGTPYPLDTCLVCGMKLSEVAKPHIFLFEDRQIKVCDPSEQQTFENDGVNYLKQLADAEAALKQQQELQQEQQQELQQ